MSAKSSNGMPTAGWKANPVHVVVPSTTLVGSLPGAAPTELDEQTCAGRKAAANTTMKGPPGTMKVPSSFSHVRQRCEDHSRTAPANHPSRGMIDPTVSSRTAASSTPVPRRRSTMTTGGGAHGCEAPGSSSVASATISSGVPHPVEEAPGPGLVRTPSGRGSGLLDVVADLEHQLGPTLGREGRCGVLQPSQV